jgi:hypothetical protein
MKRILNLISLLIIISYYVGTLFCSPVHAEEYPFITGRGTQEGGDRQNSFSVSEISSSVVSGTITGWPESGYIFYFDNYVDVDSNITAWWSGYNAATPKGYFYGENDSTDVARATGITTVNEIKDASMYSYVNWSVSDVAIGEFVLFHNRSTGYYAAFRVDNIYNNKLDITWYLQKNKRPNFSIEGDSQVTTILPSTSTSTSTTTPSTLSPPAWAVPEYMVIDNSSVRLHWSPSTSQGVIGYKIYCGNSSRSYTNHYDAGNVTNYLVPVPDPTRNTYFALTAYSSTQESNYSSELSVPPLQQATTSSATTAPASGTTIKLDPSTISLPAVGNTFTIDIKVENVEDLGGFQFDVTYTPAVVTVENNNDVTLGSFLGSTGRTASAVGPSVDNNAGKVTFGGFSFGTPAGPGGSGVLATITFTVQSRASSKINFANISFLDSNGNALQVATIGSASLTNSVPNTTTTAPGNSTTTSISSNCTNSTPVFCGDGNCCPSNKPYCGTGSKAGRCFAIPRGNFCAASFLFRQDTGVLNIFRYFRDNVLERTPAGRDYGKLFYKHSPELIMLFLSNPELKALTSNFLNNNLIDILSILAGDELTISSAQMDEIEYLCEIIKSKASLELQTAINKIQRDLKEGVLFNNLGIKITFN